MSGNPETFQDQFAASGFPPLVNKLAGAGFRGRVATRDLGPLRLVSLHTPESACIGRERDASDGENLAVEVMTWGRTRIEQGRGDAELGPTDRLIGVRIDGSHGPGAVHSPVQPIG